MSLWEDVPPWYAAASFNPPTTTLLTLVTGNQPLVSANGQRWKLIIVFAGAAGSNVFVWPQPLTSQNQGIQLNSTALPLIIDVEHWGPLVQSDWFAFTSSPGLTVGTIEITLTSWPKDSNSNIVMPWQQDEVDAANACAERTLSASRKLRNQLRSMGILSKRWNGKT